MQGQFDAPLTGRGVAQARGAGCLLRELLSPDAPARLIMSPLGRARRSADLILGSLAGRVPDIRTDARLKEISWGAFEGMTSAEIAAAAPDLWRGGALERWSVPPPGGESFRMLSERVRPVLQELLQDDHGPVVVVAHGGVRRALRGLYGGLEPAAVLALEEPHDVIIRLQAGSATVFTIEENR